MQGEDEIIIIRTARSTANMVPCNLPSWPTTDKINSHLHLVYCGLRTAAQVHDDVWCVVQNWEASSLIAPKEIEI